MPTLRTASHADKQGRTTRDFPMRGPSAVARRAHRRYVACRLYRIRLQDCRRISLALKSHFELRYLQHDLRNCSPTPMSVTSPQLAALIFAAKVLTRYDAERRMFRIFWLLHYRGMVERELILRHYSTPLPTGNPREFASRSCPW